MLRYMTSGESHGPQLTAILSGVPAGLALLFFVIPTYQEVMASMGRDLPLAVRGFTVVTYIAGYALPVTVLALLWQFRPHQRSR